MLYDFDWDPGKVRANIRKHGISFRQASGVFRDPNQLSLYDEEHSENEDRWITIGLDGSGVLRVVIHTFEHVAEDVWRVRMISARKANRAEENLYNQMIQ
ncbi:MAG: hypothetical protein COS37_06140 [Anaerolineae bacterium CG03_land_8_20_14_0_80_58_20]|nr:MAG: hypothetical protein AUJ21_06685 [Anaerolineae bacterium CG1_02_58_13]PIV26491.1 MAG: hypothetical protein COS37_06140 [Anaerolineae bacterium CG03_land_8_20_14_0_80_58_20]